MQIKLIDSHMILKCLKLFFNEMSDHKGKICIWLIESGSAARSAIKRLILAPTHNTHQHSLLKQLSPSAAKILNMSVVCCVLREKGEQQIEFPSARSE